MEDADKMREHCSQEPINAKETLAPNAQHMALHQDPLDFLLDFPSSAVETPLDLLSKMWGLVFSS